MRAAISRAAITALADLPVSRRGIAMAESIDLRNVKGRK